MLRICVNAFMIIAEPTTKCAVHFNTVADVVVVVVCRHTTTTTTKRRCTISVSQLAATTLRFSRRTTFKAFARVAITVERHRISTQHHTYVSYVSRVNSKQVWQQNTHTQTHQRTNNIIQCKHIKITRNTHKQTLTQVDCARARALCPYNASTSPSSSSSSSSTAQSI